MLTRELKYAKPEVWTVLPEESLTELAQEVAGLPSESEQEPENEEAKRFDLLILKLQLAVLRVYTDFEDEMGQETAVDLHRFGVPDTFERFRAKARAFLKEHESHAAIRKLRTNKPLTRSDLDELEKMLTTSGIGATGDVQKAKHESHGLGLFVRSLVGLDREAAKEALAGFLADKTLGANQIEFVDLIVNHLTEHGAMTAALRYESPLPTSLREGRRDCSRRRRSKP